MGGGVYKPGALRRREGASPAGFRGARLCQPWIRSASPWHCARILACGSRLPSCGALSLSPGEPAHRLSGARPYLWGPSRAVSWASLPGWGSSSRFNSSR